METIHHHHQSIGIFAALKVTRSSSQGTLNANKCTVNPVLRPPQYQDHLWVNQELLMIQSLTNITATIPDPCSYT